MRIKKTKVYQFKELSDRAKEKAREWYRDGALDYDWWDSTYEDAERAGLIITEFDLGGRKQIDGHLTVSVQESCTRILKDHGESCDTYKLALQWQATSETLSKALEQLDDEGADEKRERLEAEQEEGKEEYTRALLEEYLTILDKEWDYLNSDEAVDESIEANEYEFTEDGKRA